VQKFNHNIAGLRGVAAAAIVAVHGYVGPREDGWFTLPDWWLPKAVNFLLSSLESGVELFFMISGYLIVSTLVRKRHVGAFLLDRVLRTYPAFLVFNTAVFATLAVSNVHLARLDNHHLLRAYLLSSLMLSGIVPYVSALGVDWSLSFEWVFYLFSAAVFAVMVWCCTGKAARFIMVAASIAAGFMAVVIWSGALLSFYLQGIFFLTGVLVYRYGEGWAHRSRLVRDFGVFLVIPVMVIEEISLRHSVGSEIYLYRALAFALSIPCFTSIVFGTNWTTAALRTRFLQWLGRISYSLYLLHLLVAFGLKRVLHPIFVYHSALVQVLGLEIALFATSLAAASLSFLLIEYRLTDWLKACLHRKPLVPMPAQNQTGF
jgi:peptidoglycan/LPS O-acetylase OafA/YrhL